MTSDLLTAARHAYQRREFDQVLSMLAPALGRPDAPEIVLALAANAAVLGQRLDRAEPLLRRLRTMRPDNPAYRRISAQVHNRLGLAAQHDRRYVDAETAYLTALELCPELPEALYNLAALRGRIHQHALALPIWRRLVELTPNDGDAVRELVICLARNERLDEAARRLDDLPPGTEDEVESALLHAQALAAVGRAERIDPILRQARLTTRHRQQLLGLAEQLLHGGDVDVAVAVHDHLLALHGHGRTAPGLQYLFQRHLLLPPIYASTDDLRRHRQRYADGLDRLAEALADSDGLDGFEHSLEQLAYSNFYLAYQGGNDRDLQARRGQLLARLAPAFAPPGLRSATTPPRHRSGPARIGLVSSHFRHSTAGYYFGSWIGMLARAGHEVHVFQIGPDADDYTQALGRDGHRLYQLDGSCDDIAQAVAETGCDLLIYPELGMERRLLPLAALRLAPRQLCAWGHPVTSGLPTIDGYLTCGGMEPADAAGHYTEPLLRLPGLGTDYHRPPLPGPLVRCELGLPAQARLYLLPHAPFKMHPDNDPVWASIAHEDPDAVLVMFRGSGAAMLGPLRARLAGALARAGADPDRQLLMLEMVSRERFLEINQACDVMVDALHWSGGNTSLDALMCGLPVVTCPGAYMRSRQSAAMLRRIGLDELIVDDPAQLATTAIAVAGDRQRRLRLRERILAGLPALFDATGVAEALCGHVERLLDA